ncbi:leucyl aminopeptidase [Microcella sp.]|uniref:leucyl aminopeptidase n=1 Tax=Microcella sp. TaxID=1913979 RepID=UPI00299F8287|nr:leucyl aminopeptidase [Microcella sp.]MDX2026326.1 leucyl aminopeptidase [Microcella sp.]
MPVPSLAVSARAAHDLDVDALVVGLAPAGDDAVSVVGIESGPLAEFGSGLRMIGLTGAVDETARLPAPEGVTATSILVVGLGRGPLTPEALRSAAGTAARTLGNVARIGLALPTSNSADVQAVLEGAAMGSYRFTSYRSTEAPLGTTEVTVATSVADAEAPTRAATATARAVALVRDLVNTPPNDLYPESFVEQARAAAAELPIEFEELGPDELVAGGYGGIMGVGQGSARPPRLLVMRYRRDSGDRHLAIVGKGITFDSGGLSIKPAAAMVGMKYDMTGAATTLAAVIAAAQLELPVRLTAWLCLAENMPSSNAMRPNDVLTIRGGTTVEVLNTDAEGRLVMADGLAAASEERPDAIVDIATLTGAARVALGERYAGLMGDDALVAKVQAAAADTGELVWPMPLPAELRPLLKSDVADLANAKPGSTAAGMLLAGVFLREFVGTTSDDADAPRIPWAHLDIAGPANNPAGAFGYTPKGPSGVMVRLLVRLAERFATRE